MQIYSVRALTDSRANFTRNTMFNVGMCISAQHYTAAWMDVQQVRVILLNILAWILLLVAFSRPPPQQNLSPLQHRLFENFHGETFRGRDVFSLISRQAYLFWRNTGETPVSFLRLANDILPTLWNLRLDGNPRVRQRRLKINVINQVLLVMMWLRKYSHIDTLALWFDIDPTSVIRIIHRTLPVMWRYFQNQITWPNLAEWRNLMGNWPELPNAVGAIDATPHEIYCPLSEPQRPFYSGHRHYHCLNTQLVMDNEGHIRFLQAGFLGATHDATAYRLMQPIGPGLALDVPPGAKLLGDRGYPDGGVLVTPVRAGQMHLLNQGARRRARKFNGALSRRRVKVEHVFKEIKTFKAVSQIWRHPRWLQPICVELTTFLAERRIRLFQSLR